MYYHALAMCNGTEMENIFTLIEENMKQQQKCQIRMRGHLLIGRRKGDISKSNTQNRMH